MASQKPEEKNAVENLNEHLTSASRFVEEKKKLIFWIVAAALAVAAFVIGYFFIYKNPRTDKSFEEYAKVASKAMGNDSIATAEYMKLADKYGTTGGGNLAALQAAELLYDQGKYEQAVKYLDKFSTSEEVMKASATRLKGDCYVNLKQYDKALSTFDKALSQSKGNPQLAPVVMIKMANIYESQKKYDKALAMYEQIKADYPDFNYGLGMDAYIERAKACLDK